MNHAFVPMEAPTPDGLEMRCAHRLEKDGQQVYCLGREGETIHQEVAERFSRPHVHFEAAP